MYIALRLLPPVLLAMCSTVIMVCVAGATVAQEIIEKDTCDQQDSGWKTKHTVVAGGPLLRGGAGQLEAQ